jgi:integrase/recombinase XerD
MVYEFKARIQIYQETDGWRLKNQILVRNGIVTDEYAAKQPSVLSCHRCSLVNAIDNKFCSKCSYPLTPQTYEEIKRTRI